MAIAIQNNQPSVNNKEPKLAFDNAAHDGKDEPRSVDSVECNKNFGLRNLNILNKIKVYPSEKRIHFIMYTYVSIHFIITTF